MAEEGDVREAYLVDPPPKMKRKERPGYDPPYYIKS